MSEKRFALMFPNAIINDTIVRKSYYLSEKDDVEKLVGLLNKQQVTIDKLDQENADLLGARVKAQEEWEKCTDKLKEKILEQQATIKSKDKQLERLYNYFQYYLKDEMSGNAFSEMWDFVKEDEEWEDE